MEIIRRIPFLRLLLPLLIGIIVQYYILIHIGGIILFFGGICVMLSSYFITKNKQLIFRWLFGAGMFLAFFAIGLLSTSVRQQHSSFAFPDINEVYSGVISDIPQRGQNHITCDIELNARNKKIVCYLPIDSLSASLMVGDQIAFLSKIQKFKNVDIGERFNYAQYMYNKGFCGFTYINEGRWEKTGKTIRSDIFTRALKWRQKIISVYQSLDLDENELAVLSALTLGDTNMLSYELTETFRTTGIAHILSVSGMHVGIIYLVLSTLLFFLPIQSKYSWIKQVCIILILWLYTFVVGLPPPAVRAAIMLTVFCIGTIFRTRIYSLNILMVTAFLMLLWNPLQFFDVGFQLSFAAVLSMFLLSPLLSKKINIKNRYLRYITNISIVSVSAQIGIAPLCLYYFGSFPTYFLFANILIVPFVSLFFYNAIAILIIKTIYAILPLYFFTKFIAISVIIHKALTKFTIIIPSFFEHLPFSSFNNLKINLLTLFLLWGTIIASICFLKKKNPKWLIITLCLVFICNSYIIKDILFNKNSLTVYNKPKNTHIQYYNGYKCYNLENVSENSLFILNGKTYLILSDDVWKGCTSQSKFDLDYLHLSGNNLISLYSIKQIFNIKKVVLDSSLSAKTLKRLIMECEKLRIPYYDISNNGTLRIFF